MEPDLTDRVRALEAAMRLLENSSAERFSRLSERIGALEAYIGRFKRDPPDQDPP